MTTQNEALKDALRETNERFQALLENSCEGIILTDADAKVLYVSPAEERILGRRPEESIGKLGFAWVHPEDVQSVQDTFAEVLRKPGETFRKEFRALHKDGSWRWIECSSRNLLDHPSVRGIVINYHDITPRKLQEQEAQRQRERFEIIAHATHDVVWDWDLETDALWWNGEFYHRFGYSHDIEPTNTFWSTLIHAKDKERVLQSLESVFRSTGNHWIAEYSFRHANGHYLDVLDRGFVMRDENGKAVRMLGTVMDISERKSAELKMEKLASFVRYNPNPVFEFSMDGEIIFFNEAAERLAKLVRKESPVDLLPSDMRSLVKRCFESRHPEQEFVSRIGPRTLSWWLYPVTECGVVHCYATDITDKIKLEEQLRQTSKMEAIGQLAGGVAHDFNNILTVIAGHAALVEMDGDASNGSSDSIREIGLAAERASNLTRQLLAFGRKQVLQPHDVNCNEVVSNITRMLQRLLGEDIRLQVIYAATLPVVHADIGMLEQVLVNLAVNSRDAMTNGGQLTIETSVCSIAPGEQSAHPDAPVGDAVCIAVTDTGCGIREEDLPRIFDPFFTTKEIGKGTGLGLATVYGIVKQHKGWIKVDTEVGRGTSFQIFLPVADSVSTVAPPETPQTPCAGTETILLVEDEPPVRLLTRSILERYGYKIIEASTGAEAWNVWQQHRDAIDLVLTDMVMPDGISGRDLVEKIRAGKSDAKAICMSGYSAEFYESQLASNPGICFLQKPFQPQELCNVVRNCLNRSG